jgi:hypothetical protein
VKIFDRFIRWRVRRRHFAHLRRLREKRVVLRAPDPRCRRNSVEASP